MGGTNETKIGSLRCHENNGTVHIHDDAQNLKFEAKVSNFKDQIEDALKQLKGIDGVYKVSGTSKTKLCLCKEGNQFDAFLQGEDSVKKDIESFLKGLS